MLKSLLVSRLCFPHRGLTQLIQTTLSPLTPGHESWDGRGLGFDTFPWCSPDPTFAVSTLLDGSACGYFPLRKSSASVYHNPATNVLQWTTPGAPLTDPWAAETDSDLFSPAGNLDAAGSRTSRQLQAVAQLPALGSYTHTKRLSQSEESSTTLSPVPSVEDAPTDKSKRRKTQAHARKHSIQLRTATRKPRKASTPTTTTIASPVSPADNNNNNNNNKRSPPTEDDDLTPEERRARRNHNIVEKQYRNRLNAQFERLLAVLPLDQGRAGAGAAPDQAMGGSGNSAGGGGGDEKRMSKAEVLDLATRRIRMLEVDRERLLRERGELLRSMEVIMSGAGAVVARQGVVSVAVRRN
ncbi:hypothetical protein C8A00DRAFT_17745 [Chaetomidium leptoderma]|uniref:BHLH domain-containing protein n=1 Tax=Chaetomidium leptoderma TaxID=669021 RepID=A0AAN6VHT0_9PEZI|nr:hypothetical protein C8A00DRAFT_17745 [Chaetomidium leptoderma]